jgi:NDP-sugar pyrophosphorylase family protein
MVERLALLAGGLATRLGARAQKVPKSMLTVAGEPFIAHQLRLLARKGVREVVVCAGHLGGQLADFVGDGARFGLRVVFVHDGPRLLGTGGALRNALSLLGDSFFVMYGDSYLDLSFAAVADAYLAQPLPALMVVCRNQDRWDRSNVAYARGRVLRYDKQGAGLEFIDHGLGVLRGEVLAARAAGVPFDLGDLYRDLAAAGELAGFETETRFYEIGSPGGLAETEALLS